MSQLHPRDESRKIKAINPPKIRKKSPGRMKPRSLTPDPAVPIATSADFDPDGALSRDYLLRRGHCCREGCRNCPYGFVAPTESSVGPSDN